MLLLVTYGLRGREVAALTLDDIDWKRERLAVPERKAGHSTAFPLSAVVGEALVDYLRHGRPQTAMSSSAPPRPGSRSAPRRRPAGCRVARLSGPGLHIMMSALCRAGRARAAVRA